MSIVETCFCHIQIEELKAKIKELEGFRNECERQYQEQIDKVGELTAERDQLHSENELLWEFVKAHDELQKKVVSFDEHNAVVDRLEKARKALKEGGV